MKNFCNLIHFLIILSLILFTANIVSALTKGDFIINLASSGTGRLYVDTDPESARVRILNITPKYIGGSNLRRVNIILRFLHPIMKQRSSG